MHILSSLYHTFPAIDYEVSKSGAKDTGSAWFEFTKSIRNNILIELNINALGEIYSLDSQIMREVIGSLNWKKFADRIKTQLTENQLLTQA